MTDGQGGFLVAHLDGVPVGCGAFRMIEPGTAEIKRMFVDPEVRGAKVGAALLDSLEASAAADGADPHRAGDRHPADAALGLYERFGFAPVPAMGSSTSTRPLGLPRQGHASSNVPLCWLWWWCATGRSRPAGRRPSPSAAGAPC